MSTQLDINYADALGISALEASEPGDISIHGYVLLQIYVPFSGQVMIVSGRYNFKKVPIQDLFLESDLYIKHLLWLSLPPFGFGHTSAVKAQL